MKLLQNKLIVSILGMLALTAVLNNLGVFSMAKRGVPTLEGTSDDSIQNSKSPTNTPSVSLAKLGVNNEKGKEFFMDASTIKMRLSQWVQSPLRDPFQHFSKQPDYAGVAAFLKLSAVWRQTRTRLAVINQKVLEEGDIIEDYRIDRIEGERVWMHGPIGLEPLELELAITESALERKNVKLAVKRSNRLP
ncbi:MAG: hypothetical protein HOH33_06160 [Verrucomicrobia bacterium]|jgi:hypothetical protein|nr:hypothetical protein [Verrucomicrobiota bacterium]